MRFDDMQEPAILLDCEKVARNCQIGFEVDRILLTKDGPIKSFKVHWFAKEKEKEILIQKKERRAVPSVLTIDPVSKLDDCEGIGEKEDFDFLRCSMFLAMLQKTAENGKDPLTPEQFGRCFE